MSEETIIGIDLGTTNSLCCAFVDGKPELIPNAHGSYLTPSMVGILDDDQIVIGQSAKELQVTKPDQVVSCFKRWMGTNKEVKIGRKKFNAIELSSLILSSLHKDAEEFLGKKIRHTVITVPAYFNDNQRKATQQAGQIAGLKVKRIVNEPTAAALTYGFHDRQADKNLIVVDLGGGTFDVTIMEVFEGALEIISTAGITQLGGEDFTNRLTSWAIGEQGMRYETTELKHPHYFSRIREQCEKAKRNLQTSEQAVILIPNLDGRFSEPPNEFVITRKKASEIFESLVQQISQPINKAIRDSRLQPENIDEVILVGGATREKSVQNHIRNLFNKTPLCEIDPDKVVALGAGIQAALITNDHAVDDMVMTDVCPFTLGIEAARTFGEELASGYFSPIIHRNTTIPVSKQESFTTVHPNQTFVTLKVFQGESRKVADNLPLGELVVDGIPPGPAGTSFQVRFTYDLNGILEVEAFIPNSTKQHRAVITKNVHGLSPTEVRAALVKMQNLKFYPREDLQNQHLLLFAEKSVGEISPFHREQLESAIDYFESGLNSGDKAVYQASKDLLLTTLASLGLHWDEPK